MSYTNSIIERHVKGLLAILGVDNPCWLCPENWLELPAVNGQLPTGCVVCREFVGIRHDNKAVGYKKAVCPCFVLGKEEAIKRTWLALEEGGWLDD